MLYIIQIGTKINQNNNPTMEMIELYFSNEDADGCQNMSSTATVKAHITNNLTLRRIHCTPTKPASMQSHFLMLCNHPGMTFLKMR